MSLRTTQTERGVIFAVKAVPGGSRRRIAGLHGESLKINLTSPPEKGRANSELTDFLAETLNLTKSQVTVVSGHGNPHKQILVEKLTAEQLIETLKPFLK